VKLTTHFYPVPMSRMRGAIPPLPLYVSMVWCLVKHRDNFTFLPLHGLVPSAASGSVEDYKGSNEDITCTVACSRSHVFTLFYAGELNNFYSYCLCDNFKGNIIKRKPYLIHIDSNLQLPSNSFHVLLLQTNLLVS